jgi:transposase-like protein
MARLEQLKMTTAERRQRKFSDNFKIQKVREIETGQTKVSEICSQYQVASKNVYLWIDKFGSMKKNKKEHMVVETDSDTRQLIELKKRVSELERIIGQKQILIDFQDKMIDLAEETYGVDIKKKFFSTPSSTSGKTEKC